MFICLYMYVILCLYTAEASDLISPRTLRIVPWDFLWGGLHSIPGRPEKKWKLWTHKLHQIAIGINKVLLPFVKSGSLRGFCPYRFWGGLGQAGAPAQIGCIGGLWKYLEVLSWLPGRVPEVWEGSEGIGRFELGYGFRKNSCHPSFRSLPFASHLQGKCDALLVWSLVTLQWHLVAMSVRQFNQGPDHEALGTRSSWRFQMSQRLRGGSCMGWTCSNLAQSCHQQTLKWVEMRWRVECHLDAFKTNKTVLLVIGLKNLTNFW